MQIEEEISKCVQKKSLVVEAAEFYPAQPAASAAGWAIHICAAPARPAHL